MLRSTVPSWQRAVSSALDANILPAADMVWGDTGLLDYRAIYCRQGGFLQMHIQHSADFAKNNEETLLTVPATGHLAEPSILRLVRHFCHTGVVVFDKTDALTLLRFYQACAMYDLTAAQSVLLAAIEERLDVQSVLPLYDVLAGTLEEDGNLMNTVRRSFAAHAQEALSRVSTATATKLSAATLVDMLQVLYSDAANVCEQDLLEALYWLGLKRNKHDQALATAFLLQSPLVRMPEDEHEHEHEAKRPRLSSVCLLTPWQCVRIKGLTVQGLLAFRSKHSEAMPATWYLDVLQAIQTPSEELCCRLGLCEQKEPRTFHTASTYPLSLEIPPTDNFALTALQTDTSVTAYIGLLHLRGTAAPITLHCGVLGTLQLTVSLNGTHLSLSGCLLGSTCETGCTVTLEVVHFRSNRWRKVSCPVADTGTVSLPRVITLAALEQEGYTFDARAYPRIAPGPHLLLKLVLESVVSPAL